MAWRLRDAYAVGHSAGATDILLAAAQRPEAFARIFAIEPTVMDPADPAIDPAGRSSGPAGGSARGARESAAPKVAI